MFEGDYENVVERYVNDQEFRVKVTLGGGLAAFAGTALASSGTIGVEASDFSYVLEPLELEESYDGLLEP